MQAEVAPIFSVKVPYRGSGALATVVRSQGAALLRRALKLTHTHADASDLVQDALMRAIDHGLDRIPTDEITRWLFVVMWHLHLDGRRKAKRCTILTLDEATFPPLAVAPPPRTPLWQTFEYEDVRRLLSRLDPRVRDAYVLHEEQGLSLADTARRLRVPVGTAGTRVFRARRRLRALLSASGGAPRKG